MRKYNNLNKKFVQSEQMGACMNEGAASRNNSIIQKSPTIKMEKRRSRVEVEIEDSDLKDIFEICSCPIENLIISDKVKELSANNKSLTYKYSSAKWKRTKYPAIKATESNLWGCCSWVRESDSILDGKSYFYHNHKTHEFLVIGVFSAGSIIKKQQYYKILGNGSYYFGKLNEALEPHGTGSFFYANKDVITGSFVNGLPHGEGQLKSVEKTFKGTFKNGQKSHGKQVGKNGEYVGDFKDNCRHGKGVVILKTGQKYDGQFRQSKRYGQGTYYDKTGKIIFSGEWINDKPNKNAAS